MGAEQPSETEDIMGDAILLFTGLVALAVIARLWFDVQREKKKTSRLTVSCWDAKKLIQTLTATNTQLKKENSQLKKALAEQLRR